MPEAARLAVAAGVALDRGILILARLDPETKSALAARYRLIDGTAGIPDGALAETEIILVRSPYRVSEGMIEAAPRLRAVIRAGSGLDNIALDAAARHGVAVETVPLNAQAAAEHALALLLSFLRQVPHLSRGMAEGRWEKASSLGREIGGERAAIVGFGRIGRHLARLLNGFGCRLRIVDPTPGRPEKQAVLSRLEDACFLPLDRALKDARFLFLCCPGTPATRHLIDEAALARLPPGAVVVNVARGSVIDEAALYAALTGGHLSGACLDVHGIEPPGASALLRLPNVLATPHVGAETLETQRRIGRRIEMLVAGLFEAAPAGRGE